VTVEVTEANANKTIEIENDPASVPSIKRQPVGVAPEVYAWCFHSRSEGLIFPNSGDGVPIPMTVFKPPDFTYATADGIEFPDGVKLAFNVSFPPLKPQWAGIGQGFPLYYYDHVDFVINPPLPAGIEMIESDPKDATKQVGEIRPNVRPEQLSESLTYSITATSVYDVQGSKEVSMELSVHSPGVCALQSAKSTEMVAACSVQDSHNMINNAIYLLVTSGTVEKDVSEFFAYPRPLPEPFPTEVSGQFTCMKEPPHCNCWMWLPEEDPPTYQPRVVTGRVLKSECGLEQFGRYEVHVLAAGRNPLMADADVAVLSSQLYDFTMPARPDPKPIQFEMKVDIDYEAQCSPEVSPDAPQKCRDSMQEELSKMLGAPSEMITVTNVRPA
jgi:hypothetical protein